MIEVPLVDVDVLRVYAEVVHGEAFLGICVFRLCEQDFEVEEELQFAGFWVGEEGLVLFFGESCEERFACGRVEATLGDHLEAEFQYVIEMYVPVFVG